MELGAHMRPYSYMYCAPHRDGVLQMCILDSRDKVLRHKTVRLVRVLWRHYGVEESTREREDMMQATYPFLFWDEGTWFSR